MTLLWSEKIDFYQLSTQTWSSFTFHYRVEKKKNTVIQQLQSLHNRVSISMSIFQLIKKNLNLAIIFSIFQTFFWIVTEMNMSYLW